MTKEELKDILKYLKKRGKQKGHVAADLAITAGYLSDILAGRKPLNSEFEAGFKKQFANEIHAYYKAVPVIPMEGEKDELIEIKSPPKSEDYWRAKYLKKVEDNEAFLQRLIESSLIDMVEQQRTIQAGVQAIHQWDAQILAGGDKAKGEVALDHIRALVAGNREKLEKRNMPADTSKSDRE